MDGSRGEDRLDEVGLVNIEDWLTEDRAEAAREPGDRLRPGKAIPFERRRLADRKRRRLAPRLPLERMARSGGREVECGLERRLESWCGAQAPELCRGGAENTLRFSGRPGLDVASLLKALPLDHPYVARVRFEAEWHDAAAPGELPR